MSLDTATTTATTTTATITNRRLLVTSTAVNTIGNGAYLPTALLLLTTLTGLSLVSVGAVLTVAELVGLALMPAAGAAVDRWSAARTQTAAHALRAAGFALVPMTHSVVTVATAAVLVALGERSSRVAGPALIAETLTGPERERYLAVDRALSNAGLGVGGVVAAVLLGAGQRAGYLLVVLVAVAAFAVAAVVTAAMTRPTGRGGRVVEERVPWRAMFADRTFRLLTLANVASSFGYVALAMLIPMYAIAVLGLPAAFGGLLFTLNTVICAVATVPLNRRLDAWGVHGGRQAVLGLALMMTGFVALALAQLCDGPAARGAVVTGAIVVYTLGEIGHGPAATSLILAATPERGRGRHLAVYQMSWATAAAIAPAAFGALVTHHAVAVVAVLVGLQALAATLIRAAAPRRAPRSARCPGGSAVRVPVSA